MIASWKNLESLDDLHQIVEDSKQKPIVLFKHSTRCGISQHAKHRLESEWDFKEGKLDFYYLDLLKHRDVSNEIADQFNVVHQSPQIIILKNEQAVYHISHNAISVDRIKEVIK